MLLSLICLAHCLVFPIVIVAAPIAAGTLLSDEQFHRILLFLVVPVSVPALTSGYIAHRQPRALVPGVIGLVILIAAALAGHALLAENLERTVTSLGSVLVVISHVLNIRRMHPAARIPLLGRRCDGHAG